MQGGAGAIRAPAELIGRPARRTGDRPGARRRRDGTESLRVYLTQGRVLRTQTDPTDADGKPRDNGTSL